MSDHDIERDAELVRRIAENYRPARSSAAERVEFRARVDARIRRRARRRLWMTGVATAAVAALVVIVRGSLPEGAPEASVSPVAATAEEEALLALALPSSETQAALPADYQAIDELLLEGEGV